MKERKEFLQNGLLKKGLAAILANLMKQTRSRLRYSFMMFRLCTLQTKEELGLSLKFGQTFSQYQTNDWQSVFWAKKRQQLQVSNFKFKTPEQLYELTTQLE